MDSLRMKSTAADEWLLVGGCQGLCLVPRAQSRDYLRAQGWAALLGLLTFGLLVLIGA